MSVYRETIAISIKAITVLALGLTLGAYVSASPAVKGYTQADRAGLNALVKDINTRAEAMRLADAVAACTVPM